MKIEIEKCSIEQIKLFHKGVIDHAFVLTMQGAMALLCHGTNRQGKFYAGQLKQEVARCDFLVVCHSENLPKWALRKVPKRLQTPDKIYINVKREGSKHYLYLTIK